MADIREKLLKESMEAARKKAEAEADASEKEAGEISAGTKEAENAAEGVEKVEETVENAAENTAENCEVSGEKPADGQEDGTAADETVRTFVKEGEDGPTSVFIKGNPDKKDEKIAELNDRLLRNLAEFENFRKRTDKEKSQMFEMGAKSIIEKILPAIDSFELGLAALSEEDRASGVGQGMEKIYKQLMTILENAGVKQIEALGKEFDPNLHNAVMHEENEEFGENTVSQELQKGYMYNDSVIRHSMVKVAN